MPALQQQIGIGVAVTCLTLLVLGYPIYMTGESHRTFLGFITYISAIHMLVLCVSFGLTALFNTTTARVTQVVIFAGYGLFLLSLQDPDSLTGLPILGVGMLLAAQYGFVTERPKLKIAIATIAILVALLFQAVKHGPDAEALHTALSFVYSAIAVLGLTAGYVFVLRDAVASANQRQERLQQAVQVRTRNLREEMNARISAEHIAVEEAARAENLAAQRLELLQEVHHRARNSLQMTLTLLEATDADSPNGLADTTNRVRAIGIVYDLIDAAKDISSIVLHDYLDSLVTHVQMSYLSATTRIELSQEIDRCRSKLEATINLGLMLLELVDLAVRLSFEHRGGSVAIRVRRTSGSVEFEIAHGGKLLPSSVQPDTDGHATTGLLKALFRRLHAEVSLESTTSNVWSIRVPESAILKDSE